MRDISRTVVEDLMPSDFIMLNTLDLDNGRYLLPILVIGHPHNLHIQHTIHLKNIVFNLLRIYIFPTPNNHILLPAHYSQIPMFINYTQITTFHPAILDGFLGGVFIFPVLEHDVPAFGEELAGLADFGCLAVVVDDLGLEAVEDLAYGGGLFVHAVGVGGLEGDGGGFGHPVTICYALQSQLLDDFVHQRLRA